MNFGSVSIWDVKKVVDKVKNVVLNLSEIEIKVNDATGSEPWGASRSLMQEIAQATYNPNEMNLVMNQIYSKFAESDPSLWRQAYKALQLLEYLIKNGSESVVNESRRHESIIRALRNFHYKDNTGVDRGINIRHLSGEISKLLNDTSRLKEERKKAKTNRNKYTGLGNSTTSQSSYNDHASSSVSSSNSTRYPTNQSFSNSSSAKQTQSPSSAGGNTMYKNYKNSTNSSSKITNGASRARRNDTRENSISDSRSTNNKSSDNVDNTAQVGDLLSFDDFADNSIKTNDTTVDSFNDWGDFQSSSPPKSNNAISSKDNGFTKSKTVDDLLSGFDSIEISNNFDSLSYGLANAQNSTIAKSNTNPILSLAEPVYNNPSKIENTLNSDPFSDFQSFTDTQTSSNNAFSFGAPINMNNQPTHNSSINTSSTLNTPAQVVPAQNNNSSSKNDSNIWDMHKSLISLESLAPSSKK
ncbi:ENTH domain-containing protein [Smittium culicis]|uniref:ENTH domain-containing protein n=1 Tax=Smittium culicis TaxID=133412 RepID=A0A1R1WXI0_9FUNG|nr:ENTH domain-containing protein [Smittium culicis]OMJ14719.1 ENTH domain-containing protein [Smittium culicis]